ncbi:MAG: type I secretion system permease/ATPase [Hyphomicrobium sp.]
MNFLSPKGDPARLGPVQRAIRNCSGIFLGVGLFSAIINILALTGSVYMMQVYDRVIPSRSVPTLVGLSILMAGLYAANGMLDFFRVRIMSRVGVRIDRELREKVFAAVQMLPLRTRQAGDGLQPVRDLDQIRAFLSGLGPTAFFDVPWIPFYLAIIFMLHPLLGLFSVAGALLLIFLTLLTERKTSAPSRDSARSGSERMALGEAARRNAEVIRAMGLAPHMQRRWDGLNDRFLRDQLQASDASSGIGTITKVLRLMLQSGILGLGAYLVIEGQVSPGAIIAASIVMSRSLAPVETAIAHWRSFVSARQSRQRLIELFRVVEEHETKSVELPKPVKSLQVQGLTVAAPGDNKPIIQNVSFTLAAGEGVGVIGQSAAGKSTLARALVGVWLPMRMGGTVRLDGAALDQWAPDSLGRHIGYLPQSIELFAGTVSENIARFDPAAKSESIVQAAKDAGVHDLIVQLPKGYDTEIGESGSGLSAGQRQRVALARAMYGRPFLVVLDEPNSNLDANGDAALTEAIRSVRSRGGIAVVIAHRPSALAGVDKVLAMANGTVQAFGPKEEVLRKILAPVPPAQLPGSGGPPVVSRAGGQAQIAPQPGAQKDAPAGPGPGGLRIVSDNPGSSTP